MDEHNVKKACRSAIYLENRADDEENGMHIPVADSKASLCAGCLATGCDRCIRACWWVRYAHGRGYFLATSCWPRSKSGMNAT